VFAALYIPWYFALKYELFVRYRSLLLLWTLIVFIYALREYILWTRRKYIITTNRLIRISHEGLFKKLVMETPLERILNVSYKTTGLWSSLMKYGDVEVQVVGLMEPIILDNIKRPQSVKDYLWHLHQSKTKNKNEYTNEQIAHIQERAGYTKPNQKVL
jgi:hypothetical protein